MFRHDQRLPNYRQSAQRLGSRHWAVFGMRSSEISQFLQNQQLAFRNSRLVFGTADAFLPGMTTAITEHIERPQARFRTREQAARLLEELRDLHQSLSRDEQDHVRRHLTSLSAGQRMIQSEEF